MDLAQSFGVPEPIGFAGQTFPVRQLRLDEWAELMGFLKSSYQSPVTQAVIALQEARSIGVTVDQDLADLITSSALAEARKWPPKLGTRAWLRALDSIHTGTARFVQTVLARGGTDLDLDACQRLADQADQDDFDDLVRAAYFGDPPAPKAVPSAEIPEPTTTTTMESPTTGDRSSTSSRKKAGPTKPSAD